MADHTDLRMTNIPEVIRPNIRDDNDRRRMMKIAIQVCGAGRKARWSKVVRELLDNYEINNPSNAESNARRLAKLTQKYAEKIGQINSELGDKFSEELLNALEKRKKPEEDFFI